MSRYFLKAAAVGTPDPEYSHELMQVHGGPQSIMVHEDDLETWTGLFTADGMEIHRSERIAMGFREGDD